MILHLLSKIAFWKSEFYPRESILITVCQSVFHHFVISALVFLIFCKNLGYIKSDKDRCLKEKNLSEYSRDNSGWLADPESLKNLKNLENWVSGLENLKNPENRFKKLWMTLKMRKFHPHKRVKLILSIKITSNNFY